MSVIRIVSSTMGQSSPASVAEGTGKYYRYNGKQPIRPEARDEVHPANAKATAGRAARLAEYGRLCSEEGLSRKEAAKRLGICLSTAAEYEREIKRQRGGNSGAG